ncbi:unnamed protein product [Nyctereutes procyonoides]|uniref:(raccoon dog) hypothetical protein n=1 Tax=Nyctereutes procyonoides TaxID=34880 RepID=A0A811YIV6_NYCPR|nr:unnamed protein product [Nyctereutes procyonoides]
MLLLVPTFEDGTTVPKGRREPQYLSDIRGPSIEATEFPEGSFGILPLSSPSLACGGGGKGAIDHYVTPVEEGWWSHSRDGYSRKDAERSRRMKTEQPNQTLWTFELIATVSMLGIQKVLSPYDLT